MREIRFRGWSDTKGYVMADSLDHISSKYDDFIIFTSDVNSPHGFKETIVKKLEQYTGLVDKI